MDPLDAVIVSGAGLTVCPVARLPELAGELPSPE
jgi:hypothetical protein